MIGLRRQFYDKLSQILAISRRNFQDGFVDTKLNRDSGRGKDMSDIRKTKDEEETWQPPTEDEIRKRAYQLYLERQQECGGPLDDWLEAEAELLLRRKSKVSERS